MRYDDDISDALARRRARSANKTLTLIVLGGGGLAVLVVGVLVAALLKNRQQAGGKPTAPPPAGVAGANGDNGNGGAASPFVPIPDGGLGPAGPGASGRLDVDGMTHREMYETLRSGGMNIAFLPKGVGSYYYPVGWGKENLVSHLDGGTLPEGVVRVDRMESEEAARQAAGRQLEGTYHYGRWYFRAHPKDRNSLPAVRRILGG